MTLARSIRKLDEYNLVKVGPAEIYEDERLTRLVAFHASLAIEFIREGAAFVLGSRYIDDTSFETDSEMATATDIEFLDGVAYQGMPQALFFPHGTPDLLAQIEFEYALNVKSLYILRGYQERKDLSFSMKSPELRGTAYTDPGLQTLGSLCEEFIFFGSDGEYLCSLSKQNDRDWTKRYEKTIDSL